jgi:superfamily I DNA and RNA helicase
MRFKKYPLVTYEMIFKSALEQINQINHNEFKCAFDYILIDERQDFPDVFFELCEKITSKQVYIAGDIFQDIFDNTIEQRVANVDFVLNKCYRTDPKILMFAHSIGMGLFEDKKLNWLTDNEWKASGYNIERNNREVCLSRESIRRFEDLELENISTINLEKYNNISQIVDIINNIKRDNPTVIPDDIAIIILDTNKTIYSYIDKLEHEIMTQLGWNINRGFQSKEKINNTLFISNRNNVKGLEFPFVICITAKILDGYKYRNTLYTMLTRSFIQSFLLVKNDKNLKSQEKGLKTINKKKCIKTIEPTKEEKEDIKNTIIRVQQENKLSYKEFLSKIFDECKVDKKKRKNLESMINSNDLLKENFDTEKIKDFVYRNEEYC